MNSLYPIKFQPILKEKVWGGNKLKSILNKNLTSEKTGESWEISSVEENISVVSNGFLEGNNLQEIIEIYMGDLVGEKIYDKFGDEFPLLIKFIDATDDLSVQVHPDNKTAKERHNAYGKTELWYVIDSEKDSKLICGFNKEMSKDKFIKSIETNSLLEVLNFESVNKNDAYFLPAGRIHAIGKGILLAEIQQTSDITYRVYDWDRKGLDGELRELHTDFAIDVIDYNHRKSYKTEYKSEINNFCKIEKTDFFTANILEFDKQILQSYMNIDSFVIHICIDGSYKIIDENNFETTIKKGETVLIPAIIENVKLIPEKKSQIIEVYIEL